MWTLVYYTTASGRCPVQEYLDALDGDDAASVAYDLDLLSKFGLSLRAPHVRSVGGKLWELRTHGRVQHRILYFAASGHRLVLLHAFTKKTSKTPPREIETAQSRLADFQGRTQQ